MRYLELLRTRSDDSPWSYALTESLARIPSPNEHSFDPRYAPTPLRMMTDQDNNELILELARLQQEHRDLDAAIEALHNSPAPDLLRLQRLKKRKLQLRDRISFIEDQITPDIIA
jgi:hypothetical protein